MAQSWWAVVFTAQRKGVVSSRTGTTYSPSESLGLGGHKAVDVVQAGGSSQASAIVKIREGGTDITVTIVGVHGPYPSQIDADNWRNKYLAQQGAAEQAGPFTGIAAIGDFFQRLTQANTWIRVGEFAAGGMLLYVGLKALTSGTAVGNAASGAVKTGKKAVGLAAIVAK
jgi:hypothetical protein